MKETLSVATVSAEPGEIGYGPLEVGHLPGGGRVSLPVIIANGAQDGPVLFVGSTIHGNEWVSIEVVRQVMREKIQPSVLRGAVIAMPVLNPFAVWAGARNGARDSVDMNRVFPPNPQGSPIHQVAHAIWTQAMAKADYLIDFHSDPYPALPFAAVSTSGDKEVYTASVEMARAFGISFADAVPDTAFVGYAQRQGKPGIVVELVDTLQIDEAQVRIGVRGLLNVLKHLQMLDGELEPQTDCVNYGGPFGFRFLYPKTGGVAFVFKKVGDTVAQGEQIGIVRNLYGDVVETIASPVDGYLVAVFAMCKSPFVGTGDTIATILCESE